MLPQVALAPCRRLSLANSPMYAACIDSFLSSQGKNEPGKTNITKSLRDVTQSQLDLTLGMTGRDHDAVSLSNLSVGSKGSSKGSENSSATPSDVTLMKNNKGRHC